MKIKIRSGNQWKESKRKEKERDEEKDRGRKPAGESSLRAHLSMSQREIQAEHGASEVFISLFIIYIIPFPLGPIETMPTLMRKSFHSNLNPRLSILLDFLLKIVLSLFNRTSKLVSATSTAPLSVWENTVKGYSVSWNTCKWRISRSWLGVVAGSNCMWKIEESDAWASALVQPSKSTNWGTRQLW